MILMFPRTFNEKIIFLEFLGSDMQIMGERNMVSIYAMYVYAFLFNGNMNMDFKYTKKKNFK